MKILAGRGKGLGPGHERRHHRGGQHGVVVRRARRVQAALAVSGDEQRLQPRFPPRAEHVVGGRGLPDEGVEIDPARILCISARAGPAGEVLVEAQAHDAQAGEDPGDQGQGSRSQAEPGDVSVAIDRTASGQQQRGGEPLSLAVRGNTQRSVGGSAVNVETYVLFYRGGHYGRHTKLVPIPPYPKTARRAADGG